jgi:hypothetical protein
VSRDRREGGSYFSHNAAYTHKYFLVRIYSKQEEGDITKRERKREKNLRSQKF